MNPHSLLWSLFLCLVFTYVFIYTPGRVDATSPAVCQYGSFKCNNTKCIAGRFRCDEDDDCGDYSDESGCPRKTCDPAHYFQCANGRCVSNLWVCDQEDDCKDGARSDERNCSNSCVSDEFRCANGKCVHNSWKCDNQDDCGDNSDEAASLRCPAARTCNFLEFTCRNNGSCILKKWKCDGEDDCDDGSDEAPDLCRLTQRPVVRCTAHEFACASGDCIRAHWKCDGEADCPDGSDELTVNCPKPSCNRFQFNCSNGQCIPADQKCDGTAQCSDSSDEEQQTCGNIVPCTPDTFRCGSSRFCIEQKRVCDNHNDCPNNEDEPRGVCFVNECRYFNGHCAQVCNDLTLGHNCSCRPGFVLGSDGKWCEDINECLTFGQCSQQCTNTQGSYNCTCVDGYELDTDQNTCRASGERGFLLFSTQHSVRKMSIYTRQYSDIVWQRRKIVGLDYDHKSGFVYYSDLYMKKIQRVPLRYSASTPPEDVITGLHTPDGVAVDWVARKLYWTDGQLNMIEVSELDGTNRRSLYTNGLVKPRAIVLDPANGYLYWTDWGSNPRIERAGMDGNPLTRSVIIQGNLAWPNALTIDYTIEKIFWADAKMKTIECSDYDGAHRRLIANIDPQHPFAMTVFENFLYFTDWSSTSRAIWVINKFTGGDRHQVKKGFHSQMDVHYYHPMRQPNMTNPCAVNNGGCSHLCLIAASTQKYSCQCPNNVSMTSNGKTCEATPTTAPTPLPQSTQAVATTARPASKSSTKSSTTISNISVDKSTKRPPVVNPLDTTIPPSGTRVSNETIVAKSARDSTSGSPSTGVIVIIVLVILVVVVLIVVGLWYWRTRYHYARASIRYFKTQKTESKPLEDFFDEGEQEPMKVYNGHGDVSRCKVEFA